MRKTLRKFPPEPRAKCFGCVLGNETIEGAIKNVLSATADDTPINNVVSEQLAIMIVHRATELLRSEPMLLEIEFDTGDIIVGDLHGCMLELLSVFYEAGCPPQRRYIFLGDYVDRGKHQLELLIFLLLLKLRWPNKVYLLRGNHETYDLNAEHASQFIKVCETTYNHYVYSTIASLFDVMPVAAILKDETLCCHGGISQWMTSRDSIRNIPRPTYAIKMPLLQSCLLADILWADPDPNQDRSFVPSMRGSGYKFNRRALQEVLNALGCTLLIRGHQYRERGSCSIMPECLSVHTAAYGIFGAYIEGVGSPEDEKFCFVEKQFVADLFLGPLSGLGKLCWSIIDRLNEGFRTDSLPQLLGDPTRSHCPLCAVIPTDLGKTARLITHVEIADWVRKNARRLTAEDVLFQVPDRLASNKKESEYCVSRFPLYFDVLTLEGATYRLALEPQEWTFIEERFSLGTERSPIPLSLSQAGLNVTPRAIEPEETVTGASAEMLEDEDETSEIAAILQESSIGKRNIQMKKTVVDKVRSIIAQGTTGRSRQMSRKVHSRMDLEEAQINISSISGSFRPNFRDIFDTTAKF